jgi:hypothetical protein
MYMTLLCAVNLSGTLPSKACLLAFQMLWNDLFMVRGSVGASDEKSVFGLGARVDQKAQPAVNQMRLI